MIELVSNIYSSAAYLLIVTTFLFLGMLILLGIVGDWIGKHLEVRWITEGKEFWEQFPSYYHRNKYFADAAEAEEHAAIIRERLGYKALR